MKVINKMNTILFKDLKKGDTFAFIYNNDDIEVLMKTNEVSDAEGALYNAIHLNNGDFYYLSDEATIHKVDAELYVS